MSEEKLEGLDPAHSGGHTPDPVPDCAEDLRQLECPVTIRIHLSPEKIVKGMGESAPRDTYDMILGLEQEVGWWALTILLYRYFEGQMKVAVEKCPELVAKSDEELFAELEECE